MPERIVMGFDVSSSVIGWSQFIITPSNKIIFLRAGHIKPIKDGTIFERLYQTKKDITDLLIKYKPTDIAIEDIIQFMPKRSTAHTIITLSLFNRCVGLASYEYLNKSPSLFSVSDMRRILKKANQKKNPEKEDIPDIMESILKVKLNRFYNKNNKIKSETYDEADAVLVGYYSCCKLTNKFPKIK